MTNKETLENMFNRRLTFYSTDSKPHFQDLKINYLEVSDDAEKMFSMKILVNDIVLIEQEYIYGGESSSDDSKEHIRQSFLDSFINQSLRPLYNKKLSLEQV